MAKNNLCISDSEYIFSEKILLAYIKKLQEVSEEYVTIVSSVMDFALQEPSISIKLRNLIVQMGSVNKQINQLNSSLEGKCKAFVATINEKDKFIY